MRIQRDPGAVKPRRNEMIVRGRRGRGGGGPRARHGRCSTDLTVRKVPFPDARSQASCVGALRKSNTAMRLLVAVGTIAVGLLGLRRLRAPARGLSPVSRTNVRVAQLTSVMLVVLGIATVVIVALTR